MKKNVNIFDSIDCNLVFLIGYVAKISVIRNVDIVRIRSLHKERIKLKWSNWFPCPSIESKDDKEQQPHTHTQIQKTPAKYIYDTRKGEKNWKRHDNNNKMKYDDDQLNKKKV